MVFIAEKLGDKRVADLERLGTALYVTRHDLPEGGVRERAQRINQLKPHVTLEEAHEAVVAVEGLIGEAAGIGLVR